MGGYDDNVRYPKKEENGRVCRRSSGRKTWNTWHLKGRGKKSEKQGFTGRVLQCGKSKKTEELVNCAFERKGWPGQGRKEEELLDRGRDRDENVKEGVKIRGK